MRRNRDFVVPQAPYTSGGAVPVRGQYTLDPFNWVHGTVLEDYASGDDRGFFHVTTRVDEVERTGRLLGRRALKGVVALGGGHSNEAPDYISFTMSLDRAQWLYRAIVAALRAARGEIGYADTLLAVLEWADFPGAQGWQMVFEDAWDADAEESRIAEKLQGLAIVMGLDAAGVDPGELEHAGAWDAMIEAQRDELEHQATGKFSYDSIVAIEQFLSEEFYVSDYWDGGACASLIGFTARWDQFKKGDPAQVSIVQAAVLRGGWPEELVPLECEIRIHQEDVALVRTRVEEAGAIECAPLFEASA
jgi:hypothetical protein